MAGQGRLCAAVSELDYGPAAHPCPPHMIPPIKLTYPVSVQIYASASGVKVLNVVTNAVARLLGASEANERFLAVALYQASSGVLLLSVHDDGVTGCAEGGYANAAESPGPGRQHDHEERESDAGIHR